MSGWEPCWKRPVKVEYRRSEPGETLVSTREGITPLLSTDLVIRGVSGEVYPIARDIFNDTYTLEPPVDVEALQREIDELKNELERERMRLSACGMTAFSHSMRTAP